MPGFAVGNGVQIVTSNHVVFDDSRQLVGVATALSLAQLGDSGSVIGSLSLLVPADDVAALLAGTLGE